MSIVNKSHLTIINIVSSCAIYKPLNTMSNYLKEYHRIVQLTDTFLTPVRQGVLISSQNNIKAHKKDGFICRLLNGGPILYISLWVGIYVYCIFGEHAGLEIVSEQLWCLMSITQILAKLINGVVQRDKLKELLGWCEGNYTFAYRKEYKAIVNGVFEKANTVISFCCR